MFDGVFLGIIVVIAMILLLFIILFIRLKRKKRYDLAKITLRDIDKMTGFEFEEYLYVLFKALEYEETFLTKRSGDYGADLIFSDGRERTVVQAKRLTDKLSISAVQEVYAAKAYYNAQTALIVTSASDASLACRKLATATSVSIIYREDLDRLITALKKRRYEDRWQIVENAYEQVSYNPKASLEVIEQKRGVIRAGDYFYKL